MGLCKTFLVTPPVQGHFWSQGYNLKNFGRGPLDEATYQISKTWAFWFQTRRFFKFSIEKLFLAPVT